MNADRLVRRLFATLVVLALVAPYAQPVVCTGADHGTMTMEHLTGEQTAWVTSNDAAGGCHGSTGCVIALVTLVFERSVAPLDAPTHAEPSLPPLQSALSRPDLPVTPPPQA